MAIFWNPGYINSDLTISQSNVLLAPQFEGLTELTNSLRAILVFDVTAGGIVKVLNAVSSSYAAHALSGSYATTSSYANHAVTASYANTSSFINPYVGQTRFNTGTGKLQYWNGSAWTQVTITALTP